MTKDHSRKNPHLDPAPPNKSALLRTIIDATDVMLVYMDRNFNFLWVNPAYAESCGMKPEEMAGRNHFELYPNAENQKIFEEVRDSGKPVFFKDKPFVFPDQPERGTTYWDWSLMPVKQNGNQVEGLVFSLRETTGYMETQIALARSEERFRLIAETSGDIIFQIETNNTVSYVSPSIRSLGYTPEQVKGCPFTDFLTENELPRAQETLRRILAGQNLGFVDFQVVKADGSIAICEVNAKPFHIDGKIAGIQGTARDVTQRKQLEEHVHQAKQDWERTFDTVPDLIALLDKDHTIRRVNKAMAQRIGLSPKELVGQRCFSCVHGTGQPPAECPHRQTVLDGKEHSVVLPDKQMDGWFLVTTTPLYDREKNLLGSIHIARDITVQKEAEQHIVRLNDELQESLIRLAYVNKELERSNDDLLQFAYLVSHDLHEPLQSVSGFAQLLARRYKEQIDEKGQTFIHQIIEGTNRLQNLLNDLLAYSRVGGGNLSLQLVPLEKLLDDITGIMAKKIRETQAKVSSDGLPVVVGDATQLSSLMQNLIGNGLKYCGDKTPHIHLSAQQKEDEWIICVRDNGIGIPCEYTDRIFNLFQRLHSHKKYQGTGIGLAISKKIVERHKGRIWVESEPGVGSSFFFTLPVQELSTDPDETRPAQQE